MFGAVHGGEGKAGDGGGSVTEVMDAEAAASGGWPHTQCPVVLYEHTKCLSVSPHPPHPLCHSLKMKYSNITEKYGGVLVHRSAYSV